MSDAHQAGVHHGDHGFAHPPAEEDVIPSRKIVWVGVIALFVFLVGSLAAAYGMVVLRRSLNPQGPPGLGAESGKAKIGMVEQRLFESANSGVAWKAQAKQRLESTGWVDEAKGTVHIPIDRAMELVEKGARP